MNLCAHGSQDLRLLHVKLCSSWSQRICPHVLARRLRLPAENMAGNHSTSLAEASYFNKNLHVQRTWLKIPATRDTFPGQPRVALCHAMADANGGYAFPAAPRMDDWRRPPVDDGAVQCTHVDAAMAKASCAKLGYFQESPKWRVTWMTDMDDWLVVLKVCLRIIFPLVFGMAD